MSAEISIITPVYNGERYLAEVIESVLGQHDIEIDYIIINDGSLDTSLSIALKYRDLYPKTIRVFDQTNSGEASAVNFGFLQSTSEFVCIVNADDPLLPGHSRNMVDALNLSGSVVSYPDWKMIDENGALIRSVKTIAYSQRALVADFVCIPGPGAVMRRASFCGFLPRDTKYKYISDYVCWLRLSIQGSFIRVPEELAVWRQHQLGATAIGKGKPIADELIRLCDEGLLEIFDQDIRKKWIRWARSHAYYYAGLTAISDPSVKGIRKLVRSFLLKPLPNFGYETHHRSILPIGAVLLGPIGRAVVRKKESGRRPITDIPSYRE